MYIGKASPPNAVSNVSVNTLNCTSVSITWNPSILREHEPHNNLTIPYYQLTLLISGMVVYTGNTSYTNYTVNSIQYGIGITITIHSINTFGVSEGNSVDFILPNCTIVATLTPSATPLPTASSKCHFIIILYVKFSTLMQLLIAY